MCKSCLKNPFPERQRCTMESGSYILNFAGCIGCGNRNDFLLETNEVRKEEEDEDAYEESIEYDHICKSCNHLIAKHYYDFKIVQEGQIQEFSMSCALCGKGEDVCSSLPKEQIRTATQIDDESLEFNPNIIFPSNLVLKINMTQPGKGNNNDDDDDNWN